MLPQIVVRRSLGLYIDKVRAAGARVAAGAHAQGEEAVVRHVICELSKERWAELFIRERGAEADAIRNKRGRF